MAYGKSNRPLLAVLDRDEVFSWKLAEYMNARSSFPFEAAAFTKPDRFLAFLEEQEVGVLLMDEDLLYEQSYEHFADKAARAVPICLLLEGSRREGPVEAESPYRVLGRYRAADVLIDEILQICAEAGEALVSVGSVSGKQPADSGSERSRRGFGEPAFGGLESQSAGKGEVGAGLTGGIRESGGDIRESAGGVRESGGAGPGLSVRQLPQGCELICVYSPIGRCGKTAFSLALGEILAEEKRVIYLNLERYSGLRDLGIVGEAAGDINDLVYYCRMDTDSLVYRLSSLVRTFRDLDYITPSVSGEDIMRISAQEWKNVFAALAAAGEYDVVLVDLDISVEDAILLLNMSNRVYMPLLHEKICEAKVAQFFEAAGRLGAGALRERIRQVYLPPIREELWGLDTSARLARGKMGAYVRKLLSKDE